METLCWINRRNPYECYMYYDTHTHLNEEELYKDRRKYLDNFISVGWKGLINIWVDEEWNKRAIEIARAVKDEEIECVVKATIGYHPSEACFEKITKENLDEKILALRKLYENNKEHIVAIGECGIDTHYEWEKHIELQQELFRRQCELAKEFRLPIVIHSRNDFDSTFEVIQEFKDEKIYFHCFGYCVDEVKKLQECFPKIWFGFCGNVTYPKAQPLRDALLACDMQNVVFETDAPWLSPQKVRWEKNEPANVKYIYEHCAELLGKSIEEFSENVRENVRSLYEI